MADDDIAVDVEPDRVTIRCRHLITKSLRRTTDLVEFDPLIFNLDVPLPVVSKVAAKAISKKTLAAIATKSEYIVEQIRKQVEEVVAKLITEVEGFQKKDAKDDKNAYRQAGEAVKRAVARIDDVVESAPPKIRKIIEDQTKGDAGYKNDKLHSTGTWGFRTSKGMWLASGKFQNISKDDDKAGDELRKGLEGAKSASRSSPYEFVLASGREAGIVIRKRTTGTDKKAAIEMREGGGQIYYGDILYEKSKYVFVIDKSCSVGQGAKLAKQLQAALLEAVGKRYAIRVEGEGYGEEEDGES
ncbi:MAG: hypothetical protein HY749_22670 [Gammaproteobacteria bacterium]|nr:hypothetical protein [Gammaproteobacteria bacterium]MBI5615186.1 hypothetical protein [Gammaproteobacteria bacterium]